MEYYGNSSAMARYLGSAVDPPPPDWNSQHVAADLGMEEAMRQMNLQSHDVAERGLSGPLPERPGEIDCAHYMRTGICGFGMTCRFNHPPRRNIVAAVARNRGEYPERPGDPECQHFVKTGTCKFGATCKYHHPKYKAGTSDWQQLNALGYPLRLNEKECSHYVKTGQCKFGVTCKYHHPQPVGPSVAIPGPSSYYPTGPSFSIPSPQQYAGGLTTWPISRTPLMANPYLQGPSTYVPLVIPHGMMPVPGWNSFHGQVGSITSRDVGQQAPGTGLFYGPRYQTDGMNPSIQGALASYSSRSGSMGIPSTNTQMEHMFPERHGQPECQFYMRTGYCKYGSTCKYHHPRDRTVPLTSCTLSPLGLPLRSVLLPLINAPMIDYALEWLASVGVEEVYIFCCAHAKQVTSYLERSHWKSQTNFIVTTIESNDCVSAGDALRLIDQWNVIRGDFVLVSGDTVSNMSLRQVLQEHKERRRKDKLSVMTMVVKHTKPSSVTHQNRLGNDELLLGVDTETKQLLYYEDKKDYGKTHQCSGNIMLDQSIVTDKSAVQLYNDRQDCFIDICSPEVLLLFTDNFDYQQLRRDFVKGLLSDEVMGYKIFTYEIHSEYAARIDNFRSYDAVSKDILHRWAYPIVPDIPFSRNGPPIRLDSEGIYKAAGVMQSRSAIIGGTTFLGEGTSIGDCCNITDSVIGKGCIIGCNVHIQGCYIWNNVTIHDNAKLRYAILCDGAVVKEGAVLEPGVILSFNVVIGQNFTVPSYSKISLTPQPTEEDSDEELEYAEGAGGVTESLTKPFSVVENEINFQNGKRDEQSMDGQSWNVLEVGVTGTGYKWSLGESNQEEEWRHSVSPIPYEKIQELILKKRFDFDDTSLDIGTVQTLGESKPDSEIADDESEKPETAYFNKEVEETFRRAVLEVPGVEQHHVIIEVNSLRAAYNRSFSDCAGALFHAILNLALEAPHAGPSELFINAQNVITKWRDLLKQYLKSEDEEVEVLLKFEEICLETGKEFAPIFSKVLEVLYDKDILTEEAILSWASEKQEADESDKVFVQQSKVFIQWLQEASEEEEDDKEQEKEEGGGGGQAA